MGKIPLDVTGWQVDLLSVSGHKIYGPKGVGALYVRRRPRVRLTPLFSGGGQERGLRSGTLPAPLIVGLGEACRLAAAEMAEENARVAALRDRLLDRLRGGAAGYRGQWQHGSAHPRQPEPDLPGRHRRRPDGGGARIVRLHRLGLLLGRDRAVLCAARARPVRAAAARTLRIGIGRFTSAAEIDYAAAALAAAHARRAAHDFSRTKPAACRR